MPPRILILTASVGEGHDAPARRLADQLRAERPDVVVETEDCLAAMGRAVSALSDNAARVVFFRFLWLWDIGFWVFAGFAMTRRFTQWLLVRFGGRGLLRLISSHRPDVVVSTYPHATEVLGRLRKAGRLQVPVCAVITDLAGLRYWATPGADLHLVTHPESIDEVRRIAGKDTEVHCVHGFTAPEFLEPRARDRRAARPEAEAGRQDRARLRRRLGRRRRRGRGARGARREGGRPGRLPVRPQRGAPAVARAGLRGATSVCGPSRSRDEMPDWLAAADALVHSTGGLTVLEALMRGCPAISYGWGRGHVRAHNRAFTRFGLARVAATPAALRDGGRGRARAGADRRRVPRASLRRVARARRGRGASRGACVVARSLLGAARRRLVRARRGARRPAARGDLRDPAAPAARPRRRTDVRRRPASARGRRPCSRSSTAPACARPSIWSASRSSAGRRWRPRSPPRDTRSASTAIGTSCCCAARPVRVRDDLARAADVIGEATGRGSLSYRPPYGVFSLAGPPAGAGAVGAAPLVALGPRLGGEGDAVVDRRPRHTRASAPGAVVLLHDSDAYSATALVASDERGAAGGARRGARRAGEPLVTVSQST